MGQTQAQLQTRTQAQFRARRKYVIKSVARVFGIPASTLSYRMKRHGISVVKAAQLPHRVGRKARAAGLNASTVRNRIRKKGWTLDEALADPVAPRGPKSLTQRALAAGISPSTVSRRVLYIGMTLDEAIAAGKDMRARDEKGGFIPNRSVSAETRAKAARSYQTEKPRLRSRRNIRGASQNIRRRPSLGRTSFRLTSVPTDDTEGLRQVPRVRERDD